MNIYNKQDFKCVSCADWFHPHRSVPLALPCSHSICNQCLTAAKKRAKNSVFCPHHNSSQSLTNIKANQHIQQALLRLMKNASQPASQDPFSERRDQLQRLLFEKKEDVRAFTELLERIYNNEINRILSLKSRVLREIKEPSSAFNEWKTLAEHSKDMHEIEEEGRLVEEKMREFAELNLEEMAQVIITDPAICLQRQFSIYNLIKKQQRKTLKSSMKPSHERNSNKSLLHSLSQQNKENIYFNYVKTVDSPVKQADNSELCKQLNSFKLEDSLRSNDQLIYSPDCESIEQELLLSDKKDDVNFLREHEFESKKPLKQIQVRQRSALNCEKEKNKYIKRMESVRTEEAYYNTNVNGNIIELFNTDLKEVNLKAFLDKFDWKAIEVIKFIGTGLQDQQLNQILNYMINGKIHSLLLSNNELEEITLDALLRFTELNRNLKTVSLQRNSIPQLHSNAKAKLAMLKRQGVVVYI